MHTQDQNQNRVDKIWDQLDQLQRQRILALLAQLVLRQLRAETQEERHAATRKSN